MSEILDLSKLNKSELIRLWEENSIHLDELEATETLVKEELTIRLKAEHKSGDVVEGYAVQLIRYPNFRSVKIETARQFGAVIQKEAVNTKVLESLHNTGVEIPGVTTTEFIKIQPVEKGAE